MAEWYEHENRVKFKDGTYHTEYKYVFKTFDSEQAKRIEKLFQNEMDMTAPITLELKGHAVGQGVIAIDEVLDIRQEGSK